MIEYYAIYKYNNKTFASEVTDFIKEEDIIDFKNNKITFKSLYVKHNNMAIHGRKIKFLRILPGQILKLDKKEHLLKEHPEYFL